MKITKNKVISIFVIIAVIVTFFPYENSIKSSETINHIKSIKLSKNNVNLTPGKKTVISAKISYKTDTEELEKHIWTSYDKNIATINQDGIITAKSNGTTYILCSSKSGKTIVRCKVVVRHPYNKVSSISFPQKTIRLNIEDKRKLEPAIKLTGNKTYTTEPIEWSSSNNKIAKEGARRGQQVVRPPLWLLAND
ncbi:MAG: Ig-like domain-containing protein [Lachnospiraceae bacterium]|nr:Ig-like domain-containing protein [Lachnospiraceae bacterium]